MSIRQAVVSAISMTRPATDIRGIPPLRTKRARMGHPAKETAVELRSTGRAKPPVPTWTLPLPEVNWQRCIILAGHLRNRFRSQAFQKTAGACRVVILVRRKHDQEETIFRGR